MGKFIDIAVPEFEEGTAAVLARWLKKVGDPVLEHEPIVELETDKVVQEIAAPASGTLAKIVTPEGEGVAPLALLGRIAVGDSQQRDLAGGPGPANEEPAGVAPLLPAHEKSPLSPAVRRLIKEHQLDVRDISGSGKRGRISKRDVENHVAHLQRSAGKNAIATAATASGSASMPSRSVPHDAMRLQIAEHMVGSLLHTAPHVTSIFEADLTAVLADREAHRASFEAQGAKLTLTTYFVAAAVQALTAVPEVNSRFHDQALEIFDDINIGVATALEEKGLIVPVIQQAQAKSLLEIATTLQVLTKKATHGDLEGKDVRNGTFTISNHGTSGSLLAAPIIINQPQSAILGIGKLEKRVVVRAVDGQDALQIRPMLYVTLTIDHRALDGYQTNRFLSTFVDVIEHWGEQR